MLTISSAAAVLGAIACLAATNQAAAASASATISNVYIQVFSLSHSDPNAGQVTFDSFVNGNGTQDYSNSSADNGATQDWHFNSGPMGSALPPVMSGAPGGVMASASVSAGDLFTLGSGPGASAAASGSGAAAYAYGYGYVLASAFTISPHTLLVITADTSGLAASAATGQYADGSATVQLYDSAGGQHSYGQAYAYVNKLPGNDYGYSELSPHITASFVNLTGGSLSGYAYAQANSYISSAVPEPLAVAMLLAGIAVVGWSIARQRSGAYQV